MAVALEERMRAAAALEREVVLDSENHAPKRDLSSVLNTADIYWRGIAEERRAEVEREAEEFERALAEAGVLVIPQFYKSLKRAWERGRNPELTLKLDEAQLDAAADSLRETVLELTTWLSGKEPGRVFAAKADQEEGIATTAAAAAGLCLVCVPRESLAKTSTFDLLHLLAPRLSAARLHRLERCLRHVEAGESFEEVLHPGLTELDRMGVVPIWPDPGRTRQHWAVAAEPSWVVAAPVGRVTSQDADGIVRQMIPRWERASLPEHGAALCSVLVEVAIESAVQRAQALGRAAEEVFPLGDEQTIHAALDRLAQDLAELNAGLDELEVAAADSRTDLHRRLESLPAESEEASLYASLCTSLEDALAKLERSRHRLQGSFLAAREHASSRHVAATIDALRLYQESLTENQRATDELNRIVGLLTIMLLGPTIVFGALSVTDHWLPVGAHAFSIALLFGYVFAGLAVSLLIRSRIHLFTRFFAPRTKRR